MWTVQTLVKNETIKSYMIKPTSLACLEFLPRTSSDQRVLLPFQIKVIFLLDMDLFFSAAASWNAIICGNVLENEMTS